MKKNIKADIARLFAVLFAIIIVIMSTSTMTVSAAGTDYGNANAELYSNRRDNVNTLGATMTIKTNSLKVKKNNAAQILRPTKVVVDGVTLKLNKNYTVSYQVYDGNYGWEDVPNMTAPGLYRVCVVGIGNYSGVCTNRVYVYDPKDGERGIPMTSVKVTVNKMAYTGEPVTEGVIKSVKYKKATLVEGEDYTVTYLNNVNSGTGVVRITAVDGVGFVGEKDVNFQITGGTKINKAKVTGITAKTYDYGNALTQDMSQVKVKVGKNELVYGVDYDVAYYMNNSKVGTAKIVITGKGRYNGTITKTFKINKITLNADMLDDASRSIAVEYTKKAVKPDVTLYGGNGEQLVKNVDYTLAYKNNVKISDKAVIIVKGKGNYAGSFNVNFSIRDKKVEETKKPEKPETPVKPEKPETPEKPEVPEKPETPETPDIGDGSRNDDESKDDEPKTDDESDESKTDDESKGDESKTDEETKSEVTKPIAFRICECGGLLPVYTYGLSDTEKATWKNHSLEHMANGWQVRYTAVTYEKALKYKMISEDANGQWTLLQGTLILPSESKPGEIETEESTGDEFKTDEESKGDDESKNDDGPKGDDESKNDEETRSEVTKPIGFRICECEGILPVYTYGLSDTEKATWNNHINEHMRNGWQARYNAVTYEKALKYKIISEDANGQWTLLQGTLILPSESKPEESELIEETKTEVETEVTETITETETTEPTETTNETTEETTEDTEVIPTEEPKAEVDPDKLIGERICWCGCNLEIYGRGLSNSEEKFWKDHMARHERNGECTDYEEHYF